MLPNAPRQNYQSKLYFKVNEYLLFNQVVFVYIYKLHFYFYNANGVTFILFLALDIRENKMKIKFAKIWLRVIMAYMKHISHFCLLSYVFLFDFLQFVWFMDGKICMKLNFFYLVHRGTKISLTNYAETALSGLFKNSHKMNYRFL